MSSKKKGGVYKFFNYIKTLYINDNINNISMVAHSCTIKFLELELKKIQLNYLIYYYNNIKNKNENENNTLNKLLNIKLNDNDYKYYLNTEVRTYKLPIQFDYNL